MENPVDALVVSRFVGEVGGALLRRDATLRGLDIVFWVIDDERPQNLPSLGLRA